MTHYVIAAFTIMIGAMLIDTIFDKTIILIKAMLRSFNVAVRGWPPYHVDAGGESIVYDDVEDEQEDNSAVSTQTTTTKLLTPKGE